MSGAKSKTRNNIPGHSGSKTPIDKFDLYLQLFEIQAQFHYLGEHRLERAVLDRLDELWDSFDASEHKDLAIAVANMGG